MKKFKLRKVKITPKDIQITIFILVMLLILIIPLKLGDNIVVSMPSKTPSEIIKSFNYEGELTSLNIFQNEYASILYKTDEVYKGHLINLKAEKEVLYNDFIKEEEINNFNNKIHELLLLKYPKIIVNILENDANKEYSFEDRELVIYFYPINNLETTRKFNIRVNYQEIYQYLNFDVTLDETYSNESGYDYDSSKRTVSFTFDDGPNNTKTIAILSALEDYKMSATFFMVGYKLENDAQTVISGAKSHSEIGYHSYKHSYFTKQSTDEIKREFKNSDDILYNLTGKHFILTRPPYGAYNKNTLNAIDNIFIRWNLDTNDWRYKDVDYIENYVLSNITDGDIILFHDSYATSVDAVIDLIEKLYMMDIQVVSVSKLAELKNINLENHEVYYSFK